MLDEKDKKQLEKVTSDAIDDMPDDFMIKDMLMKNKEDVVGMIMAEYLQALNDETVEGRGMEQYQFGKRESAFIIAENLLKEVPEWSDEEIAEIVEEVSADEVYQLRHGARYW